MGVNLWFPYEYHQFGVCIIRGTVWSNFHIKNPMNIKKKGVNSYSQGNRTTGGVSTIMLHTHMYTLYLVGPTLCLHWLVCRIAH